MDGCFHDVFVLIHDFVETQCLPNDSQVLRLSYRGIRSRYFARNKHRLYPQPCCRPATQTGFRPRGWGPARMGSTGSSILVWRCYGTKLKRWTGLGNLRTTTDNIEQKQGGLANNVRRDSRPDSAVCNIASAPCRMLPHYCGMPRAYCPTTVRRCTMLLGYCGMLPGHCRMHPACYGILWRHCRTAMRSCGMTLPRCDMLPGYCHILLAHRYMLPGGCRILLAWRNMLARCWGMATARWSMPLTCRYTPEANCHIPVRPGSMLSEY